MSASRGAIAAARWTAGGTLVAFLLGAFGCPSARLLHVPCPACGTTRAAQALIDGDLSTSLRIHPIAPFVFVLLMTLFARGLVLSLREGSAGRIFEGRAGRALLALGALCAVAELAVWGARWLGMFGGPVPV